MTYKKDIITDKENLDYIIKKIYDEKGSTFENILKRHIRNIYFNKTPLKINKLDVKYR